MYVQKISVYSAKLASKEIHRKERQQSCIYLANTVRKMCLLSQLSCISKTDMYN